MFGLWVAKLQGYNTITLIKALTYYDPRLLKFSFSSFRAFHPSVMKRREPYLVKVVQGKSCKGKLCAGNTDHRFGEDSWFMTSTPKAEVMGVADGVGGWSEMGIDSGCFAKELMYWCSNYAKRANFDGRSPIDLLSESYSEIKGKSRPVVGSSTACLVALRRKDCTMHTANLGDSGFMVIRNGRVLHRSREQVHEFNTPYQLSVPPNGHLGDLYSDSPDMAESSRLALKQNDLVLLATDGLFDNMPESLIVKTLRPYQGTTKEEELQAAANVLVSMAKDISISPHFQSPFALKARAHNLNVPGGGKPDDITVILATVAIPKIL